MSDVDFKIQGEDELKRRLLSLGKDMESAMIAGVFLTAQQVRTHAIKSIQEQSFGTWTKRSRQGGGTYDHIAAAPGNAPNTDTGKLVSSIAVEKDEKNIEAEVGSNLDYATYLEFGTEKKNGGGMDPRPWLQPALDSKRQNLESNIAKAAMKVIAKRAGK